MSYDLLIDGYNLMHFAGLARQDYGPGGLERARERLLKRVRRVLTDDEVGRTTFVFDAKDVQTSDSRHQVFRGMRILFSPTGKEADDVIEQLILDHSSPKQLVVVSSDNRLMLAAKRRKAGTISSEAFLDELDERAEKGIGQVAEESPQAEKPEVELTDDDLAAWEQEFGKIDVASLMPKPPAFVDPPTQQQESSIEDLVVPSEIKDDSDLIRQLEEELRRCQEEDF
ncbi:MAG: NYN domain-containing protein [Planctomycetaceae bacterium]|nr:NYN domain-containing protein [Planctomycetaceae bacterium]MCA9044360.1 NYN domain-containing protein [Planctomycetaceae bacterium]MCB9951501.1 NYN domain-containing protein [Planctomycetaceae bacterium]